MDLSRNILADPRVRFQVAWRRYQGLARPLPPAESGRHLAGYARRHPRAAASLLRAIGQDVDGSDAAYERIGSDPEHGIPLVRSCPGDGEELWCRTTALAPMTRSCPARCRGPVVGA
jgi:hypothetical protein